MKSVPKTQGYHPVLTTGEAVSISGWSRVSGSAQSTLMSGGLSGKSSNRTVRAERRKAGEEQRRPQPEPASGRPRRRRRQEVGAGGLGAEPVGHPLFQLEEGIAAVHRLAGLDEDAGDGAGVLGED